MKVIVIHNQAGKVIGALRAAPQKLADGREMSFIVPPGSGHKMHVVEVPDHLRGSELLKHAAKARP